MSVVKMVLNYRKLFYHFVCDNNMIKYELEMIKKNLQEVSDDLTCICKGS